MYHHSNTLNVILNMSKKTVTELVITSESFSSSQELLDYLLSGNNFKIKAKNEWGIIDLKVDDEGLYTIQEAYSENKQYPEYSILGFLDKSAILIEGFQNQIKELNEQIKLLEKGSQRDSKVNKKLKKRILKLRNKGYSYQAIADILHDEGLKNSFNNRINSQLVRRLYIAASKESEGDKSHYVSSYKE